MPKLKTVIDCNIIISAGITDGSCRKAIREILSNHQNYLSQDILLEYKNVISRSKFRLYEPRLISLIKIICQHSILVEINHLNYSFNLPDLSDEIYLKTAIEANCDFLITGNLKDFPKRKYDNLRIVSVVDFLKL